MPRTSDVALSKHTLMLREGDYPFLRERFKNTGAAVIIRRTVSKLVDSLDQPVDPKQIAQLLSDEEINDQHLQASDRPAEVSSPKGRAPEPSPAKSNRRPRSKDLPRPKAK